MPLAIVDVHYEATFARAACVVARSWADSVACEERTAMVDSVLPYRPGAFFERELPCLVAVLAVVETPIRVVVVDGYVELDERGTAGLGAHLYDHFGGALAVVGVAKTAYRGSAFGARVVRGEASQRPLFVTARGVSVEDAARLVAGMHGAHRIPTLLRRADQLARGLVQPAG